MRMAGSESDHMRHPIIFKMCKRVTLEKSALVMADVECKSIQLT